MNTEKQLQGFLFKQARMNGILADKLESRSRRGWPDVFLAKDGRIVLVEVKSPAGTGRLSPLQVKAIDDLHNHGVRVEVVDSEKGVLDVIEYLRFGWGVKYATSD